MNQTNEIEKLIKARVRIERTLKELDQRIDHIRWRMDEEKRCMARKCPLEDTETNDRELM